ncbi:MAG: COPII coat Sec23p-Sfb3p heterodimer component [Alyxoria varia]|nr:MAG: COPII coat Sec23p-Sfb3p heterodimer component [Alyxoria varia]
MAYQGNQQYGYGGQYGQSTYGQPNNQGSAPPGGYQQNSGHVPQDQAGQPPTGDGTAGLNTQMAGMGLGPDGHATARGAKKKGRHAYHEINNPEHAAFPPQGQYGGQIGPGHPPQGDNAHAGQAWSQNPSMAGPQYQAQAASGMPSPGFPQPRHPSHPDPRNTAQPQGAPASSSQGRVDPEQIPSVPSSRDAPAEFYLQNVYPTMEQHLPPPASVPFVAVDQGNASPKFARLTLNSVPTSSETLNSTSIPLGLVLQPLARKADGEQEVPVIQYGDEGPPRCRRCRTYMNPFMIFRQGGNKFVCNMCTFPNDVATEYYAPTDPSGSRVDRMQRPELSLGTVEFAAPREYWTKEPVPQRWLFMIDVSMEAVSKGFLEAYCQGILRALYEDSTENEQKDGEDQATPSTPKIAPGSQVGFMTFDREIHFYNVSPGLEKAQMVVMPDIEEPFAPIGEGLYVEPMASKDVITSLLNSLPHMFMKVKNPEPALLPALRAGLDALKSTGGRLACSLASLPTWGPGRLFLRERPEMRDTDDEKALFGTKHPGFIKVAKDMTEHGVGIDFFLAAPQGGYLDVATVGYMSEKTGGEIFYYPNFHFTRDQLKLRKEVTHTLRRTSGFQALLKVRCSNGLQVSNYFGNFTQHTFGADLEFGVIDEDKSFGALFTYDGKLDPSLDAHFQAALLYTTATGERRIRCSNVVASVTDTAMNSLKLVDQDALVSLMAKQAAAQIPERPLKDIRNRLTEKTIDILAAYRRNYSGSHPPGQLVLPDGLKEFAIYSLCLLKSRALQAGTVPTDRRVFDMYSIKSMGPGELSLYLYPRVYALHSLTAEDGFPLDNGHLRMPSSIRASYSRVEEGGAYLVDCGHVILLWLHAQVSPNLLEDLFGPGLNSLQSLDPLMSELPVLETHLNAQVRNILQYLEDNRGSKGLALQLARQGMDGSEFEFARLLVEDKNGEAQNYVDWLVYVHRHIQLEGQRQKSSGASNGGDGDAAGMLASVSNLASSYF